MHAVALEFTRLPLTVQGKYINDAQVLREIAREAQLEDPDRVADDPTCCAKEVGIQHQVPWSNYWLHQQCCIDAQQSSARPEYSLLSSPEI